MRLRKIQKSLLGPVYASEKFFKLFRDFYETQINSKTLLRLLCASKKSVNLLKPLWGLEKFQRPCWDPFVPQKNSKDLAETPPWLRIISKTPLRPIRASEKFFRPFWDYYEAQKNSQYLQDESCLIFVKIKRILSLKRSFQVLCRHPHHKPVLHLPHQLSNANSSHSSTLITLAIIPLSHKLSRRSEEMNVKKKA